MNTTRFAFLTLILLVASALTSYAQSARSIEGVYRMSNSKQQQLWILVDGYSSRTTYASGHYISAEGGTYTWDGNQIVLTVEYSQEWPEVIGAMKIIPLKWSDNALTDSDGNKWERLPTKAQELDGCWQISGRMNEGEIREINHTGTRKTIKLLKDGYFQWVAIDPGKREFYATGGGNYSFNNGKYTEEIVFFSRDNSRIGAKLEFDGKIENGDWHHQGLSSKGEPIYEVWSRIRKD